MRGGHAGLRIESSNMIRAFCVGFSVSLCLSQFQKGFDTKQGPRWSIVPRSGWHRLSTSLPIACKNCRGRLLHQAQAFRLHSRHRACPLPRSHVSSWWAPNRRRRLEVAVENRSICHLRVRISSAARRAPQRALSQNPSQCRQCRAY